MSKNSTGGDDSGCGSVLLIAFLLLLTWSITQSINNFFEGSKRTAPRQYESPPPSIPSPLPLNPMPILPLPPSRLPQSLLSPNQPFPEMAPPPGMPDLRLNPPNRRRVRCFEQENMFGGGSSTVCEEF